MPRAVLLMLTTMLLGLAARGQTYKVLYSFTNGRDGASPHGLAMDKAGNFYGTTGAPGYCFGQNGACGGVFKFARSGTGWILTPIYQFKGGNDGSSPAAGVTIAADGSLYGTTTAGGNGNQCDYGDTPGCGTVYHLRPPATRCASFICEWNDTVLYAFHGYSDLQTPYAEVTFDQSGNLFGAAIYGGSYSFGGGVFELTPSQGGWSYDFLFNFKGQNGSTPYAPVLIDQAGNLFGTTAYGGMYNGGVVFEMSPSGAGWTETVLHHFGSAPNDGVYPLTGLISDAAGNLFGCTSAGGQTGNGTVFELSPANGGYTYTVLYDGFSGLYGSGSGPYSKLVMDSSGNLYGTQFGGGTLANGLIFKLTPGTGGWTFTDLHDFTYSDGAFPIGNLALDANGNLFGSAEQGGAFGYGVIWALTP